MNQSQVPHGTRSLPSKLLATSTLVAFACVVPAMAAANQAPVATGSGGTPPAVTYNSSTDELLRTTSLPPITGFTMMGWFRVDADHSGGYETFLGLSQPTSSNAYLVLTSSGPMLSIWNGASLLIGPPLTVGTWYHIAMTVSGPGTGQFKAYLNGVLALTGDANAAVTSDRLSIGNDSHVEWFQGGAADVKVYDASLTQAEIAQEMSSYAPVRTSGLNSWYPLKAGADAVNDYSGNARTLTLSGTLGDDPNGPPLQAGGLSTAEDTPVSGTLQATDADGDPLTFSIVSNGSKGVATITDPATGAFIYTPNPNANGSDSFTFKANDGQLDSNIATINVIITPVDDPPVASNGGATVAAGSSVNGTLQASDIDSPSLTYSVVTNATQGTATITNAATGAYKYTANAGASGTDSFTFKANDGSLDSNIATITVTITAPASLPPTASNGTLSAIEDTPASGTLVASDPARLPLSYVIVSNGAKGTATITNASTGAYTYTPNPNANGADSFTFKANNGSLDSNIATVSVSIAAVNDPPVAVGSGAPAASVAYDNITDELLRTTNLPPVTGFTMMGWFRVAADHSGGYETFLGLSQPTSSNAYLVMTSTGPVFSLWNGAGLKTGSTLTVGTWYHIAISVSGTGPGQASAYLNGALDIVGDGNVAITADRMSIGNDSHSEWFQGNAADVKIYDAPLTQAEIAQEMSSYAPVRTAGLNAWYPLQSASDAITDYSGNARALTMSGSLTNDPNGPPLTAVSSLTTAEDTPVSGTLHATDVDGDPLTFSIVSNGTKGVATITNASTGAFTYTPNPNANGNDSFTFKANDGQADSNIATINVSITPVNDAPVASNGTASVSAGGTVSGRLVATDVDSPSLTYSIVTNGTKGTATITNAATGAYSYTALGTATGTDTFTFRANDGSLNSNTATITVTIGAPPAPTASNGTLAAVEDTVASGTLVATDPSGRPLTYSIVANGTKGTAAITNAATGAYTYTPKLNANGGDSFTFKANNGLADSNIATISVTIAAVNDPPVASNGTASVVAGATVSGTLVATDVDSTKLTYSIVANGSAGVATITNTATGAYTYTANAGASGTDTFTFRANDGSLNSNTATITVNIAASVGPAVNGTLGTGDILIYAAANPTMVGNWRVVGDTSAAGGLRLWNPDLGAAKITTAKTAPSDYVEITFNATAGVGYRFWMRGKAQGDTYSNDSVFVQFNGSVNSTGGAIYRIGTNNADEYNLENCSGCGEHAWGWQDDAYGVGVWSQLIYFNSTGPQTMRIQVREDGLSIDQIMFSPQKFLSTSPGTLKDDTTIYPATGPSAPPPAPAPTGDHILYAWRASIVGNWKVEADTTAAGGFRIHNPNLGAPKIVNPSPTPKDYIELTFSANAGTAYHFWMRGKAEGNSYSNDSVHVQFSDSVDASGNAVYRIGTNTSTEWNLEDCSGCGESGWGWQDNGWGVNVMGPNVYFATTGTHTIRIQVREDGVMLDQIIFSPQRFLTTSPGLLKNDTTIYPETP